MRYLYWIPVAMVAVLAASFAVSNRAPVTLELWPLPSAIETPLYVVVLAVLLTGIILGFSAGWLSGGRTRRERRHLRRHVKRLERDLAAQNPVLPPAPQTKSLVLPAHHKISA